MQTKYRSLAIGFLLLLMPCITAGGQKPADNYPSLNAGDSPDNPGPVATDVSPAFTPQSIAKATRKVGDWELAQTRSHFSQDWTYAALYRGFLAAAKSLPSHEYEDAMLSVGKQFDWKLGPRQTEGDDQAVGYLYLELYMKYRDAKMLEPTKSQFDDIIRLPNLCTETCPPWSDKNTPAWWWADSFFMAPPVWADLYKVTGDRKYLDHMDQNFWVTSKLLYDPQEHLYSRDESYLNKHEANGKKIFWSRGNGWVIAGMAQVLQVMPKDYPSRPRYLQQFRDMAARLKSVQGEDGLWRPGLLDASSYPLPENSGSAFFVYALAWGINNGVLDRATYLPVVKKGWAGLVAHIYADGRFGSIQPIGAGPDAYKPQTSYVFGVGAFLLAGSQAERLAGADHAYPSPRPQPANVD
jgi:rhamnogalacturonyl hydrolase YesR